MTHASQVQARQAWAIASPTMKALVKDPARQAFWALRIGFTIAPIVMGLDKFAYWLVDWNQYLSPSIAGLMGGDAHAFMRVVGVIEIAAGIGVAFLPRIFSWVVVAWLLGIIGNLLMLGGYYDIAVRDLGLAIGALALARLSEAYGRGETGKGQKDRAPFQAQPTEAIGSAGR